MREITLRVQPMHCHSCIQRVTQTLNSIPGVKIQEVELGAARVHLLDATDPARLTQALNKAGYTAQQE